MYWSLRLPRPVPFVHFMSGKPITIRWNGVRKLKEMNIGRY